MSIAAQSFCDKIQQLIARRSVFQHHVHVVDKVFVGTALEQFFWSALINSSSSTDRVLDFETLLESDRNDRLKLPSKTKATAYHIKYDAVDYPFLDHSNFCYGTAIT